MHKNGGFRQGGEKFESVFVDKILAVGEPTSGKRTETVRRAYSYTGMTLRIRI